jgi:hypothetical protein
VTSGVVGGRWTGLSRGPCPLEPYPQDPCQQAPAVGASATTLTAQTLAIALIGTCKQLATSRPAECCRRGAACKPGAPAFLSPIEAKRSATDSMWTRRDGAIAGGLAIATWMHCSWTLVVMRVVSVGWM